MVEVQNLEPRAFLVRRAAPLRLAVIFASLLGLSCHAALQHFPKTWDRRVSHQNEAGTIHVGVQSTAAFDEYISLLQPSFSLNSEQALAKAIPIVQSLEFREAVAVSVAAALSFAQTSGSTTVVDNVARSKAADSDSETNSFEESRSSTETKTPGAVSVPELAARIEALLDKVVRPEATLAFEPTAQYQAAASLLQQVAILNSYVKEAAVSRGTVPFVVRLLVSVFPNASRSPYNAFVDLRFAPSNDEKPLLYDSEEAYRGWLDEVFSGRMFETAPIEEASAGGSKVNEEEKCAKNLRDCKRDLMSVAAAREQADILFAAPADGGREVAVPPKTATQVLAEHLAGEVAEEWLKCGNDSMEVLPLFATDSLEATELRRTELQSRDFGGAVGGSVGSVGVGVSGRGQSETSGSGAGRELRGILTLAQAGEGHLSLRIGAMANESSSYLGPRTYSVALLALVPAKPLREMCLSLGIQRCKNLERAVGETGAPGSKSTDRDAAAALYSALDSLVITCPGGRFVGRSRFRHATSGVELYQPGIAAIEAEFDSAASLLPDASSTLSAQQGGGLASEAIGAAFRGEWGGFTLKHRSLLSATTLDSLRIEAERLLLEAGFVSGKFQVPARYVDFFRDPTGGSGGSSSLVLFDDEKSRAYFELVGAQSSAPAVFDSTIFLTLDHPPGQYTIESTSSTKTSNGWRFGFPSLKPLLKPREKDKDGKDVPREIVKANATVRMYRPNQRWRSPDDGFIRATYPVSRMSIAEEPAPKPTATLMATQSHIAVEKDGTGVLQIEVGGAPAKDSPAEIRLAVNGGYLTEILSEGRSLDPGAYEIKLPLKKRYLLRLAGLVPSTVLKLQGTQMAAGKEVALPEVQVTLVTRPSVPEKKAGSGDGGN